MYLKIPLLLLLLFIRSLLLKAPVTSVELVTDDYPKGYFRNPLDIPIQLAANFGELRNNHFHMGFDIRTNQRENLNVYAAADGYVSRIKIERFGFGRVIYINHPNGYTTVYAHLNSFYDALQQFLVNKQYADEQWEQEVTFLPGQFPVKKGQFIALSGNTGGSQGPHLHFEIRNTKTEENLNPWLFDFGLKDNQPPLLYRLYYFDRRFSTYQFGPIPISIAGANASYRASANPVVLTSPYISFGISAEDRTTKTSFRFGIYQAELYIDSVQRSSFTLNNISYKNTRYLNASIDYKTRVSSGPYIQHLSKIPGNLSSIFLQPDNGTILITDTLVHDARVVIKDAQGNATELKFRFRWSPAKTTVKSLTSNFVNLFPQRDNVFRSETVEAHFSSRAFYDTVPFEYHSELPKNTGVVSAIHYLHNYQVPVHDSFAVRIKTLTSLPEDIKNRVVLYLQSNRKTEAFKGTWNGDWFEGKIRDLGILKLIVDTMPAKVTPLGWVNGANLGRRSSLTLLVKDNAGEINSFKAYIDGKWLMFSRKDDLFIHSFDGRTSAGSHELSVVVEDCAGNITRKTFKFSR